MSNMTGIVEVVSKNAQGYWSIKLDGKWVSTGKIQPNVKVGDKVSLETKQNEKGYLNMVGNVMPITASGSAGAEAKASASAAVFSNDGRQDSIIYQSSRKDALEFMKMALAAEAIKLPAKAGDKYDALMALLDELTLDFVQNVKTLGAAPKTAAATEMPGDDE